MSNRTVILLSALAITVALVCIVWGTYTLCTDVLPYDWSSTNALAAS